MAKCCTNDRHASWGYFDSTSGRVRYLYAKDSGTYLDPARDLSESMLLPNIYAETRQAFIWARIRL